jgi:ribosomal protein S18 acetylase RimI-like enzyme
MDDAIVDALERNLWALWSRFGHGDGCALHDEDGALWFDTPIPTLPYNAVIRFRATAGDADHRIDAIIDHYRRRGVPFLWIVHPSASPPDLGARLARRGLEEAEVCAGMSMALDALPPAAPLPEHVDVHPVTREEDVAALFELIAWRWQIAPEAARELPRVTRAFGVGAPQASVRGWVARRRGVPVAKVVLNVEGGIAGIYGVATKPEARGLGLARLLTLHALEAARLAGCHRAVLHATPMARALYDKIGFRVHAPFAVHAPPQALHL